MSALKPGPAPAFGWVCPMFGPPDGRPIALDQHERLLDVALESFDSVWVCDHFYGYAQRTDPFLEAWTTITWLAASHPNVAVGLQVLGIGYRNPALLAKMAATLQLLSGGRLVLGLGAGYREEEYTAYGYPFPRGSVRIAQLEEAVQICRLMWTETSPSFTGEHFTIAGANCQPHPDPVPPIMIGGSSDRTLGVAGRRADAWNTNMKYGVDLFRQRRATLRESAERSGRDPDAITLTLTHDVVWPTTSTESAAYVELLRGWVDEGVGTFLFEAGDVKSLELVERFADEVLAPLRSG